MREVSTEAVARLAEMEGLELGDELDAVAARVNQLLGFARELDDIAADEAEIGATFDPRWEPER